MPLRLVAALFIFPTQIYACLCIPTTRCQDLAKAEVVFLGTPTAALAMSPKLFGPEPFVVRVDNPIKGLKPEERQLRLFVGRPNYCPLPQVLGKQYVYFAKRVANSDVMEASYCSGSFEVTPSDERWIQELSKSAKSKSNFLYGEWEAILKWLNPAPPPASNVELLFKSQRHQFRITTEASGEFWHHAVPPGKYNVSAAGFSVADVQVPLTGCIEVQALRAPTP